MFHLIIKDMRIQKKTFLFAAFYTVFATFAFRTPSFSESIYIMLGVAITYIFTLTAVAYDEKNKSEVLLLSLPIKKKHVVFAKYLSVFAFCLIGIIISGFVGAVLNITGLFTDLRFINLIDIIAIFISMSLLMAVYYPFYFKFGATHIRILNVCFFMLVFFAPSTILKFLIKYQDMPLVIELMKFISHTAPWGLGLLMFFIVFIILIISLFISLKIYENKNF